MAHPKAAGLILLSYLTLVMSLYVPKDDSPVRLGRRDYTPAGEWTYPAALEDGTPALLWKREPAGATPQIVSVVEVSPGEARAMHFPDWPKMALATRDPNSRDAPDSKTALAQRDAVENIFYGNAYADCPTSGEVNHRFEMRTTVDTDTRVLSIGPTTSDNTIDMSSEEVNWLPNVITSDIRSDAVVRKSVIVTDANGVE